MPVKRPSAVITSFSPPKQTVTPAVVAVEPDPQSAARERLPDAGELLKKFHMETCLNDGLDANWLAQVFARLDGEVEWTEDLVKRMVAYGCGENARTTSLDDFLQWLFSEQMQQASRAATLRAQEEDDINSPKFPGQGAPGADVGSPKFPAGYEGEINSPKVPARRKKRPEKRANIYLAGDGERLFRPESHQDGVLLLRPNSSFSYVHDAQARFSEGVQGVWSALPDDRIVRLVPRSFGYCYQERFDAEEILGVSYDVKLNEARRHESGASYCLIPESIRDFCSWLDPTKPEAPAAIEAPVQATSAQPEQPEASAEPDVELEECPTSPKVPARKRRNHEKRAYLYKAQEGEQLYCPSTYQVGLLLLCPDGTFSYVHDSTARFSEGVQGWWTLQDDGKVLLQPTGFGYCYEESFDLNEVLGSAIEVMLNAERRNENGILLCELPEELQKTFSWVDPTLPEPETPTGPSAAHYPEELEECPASPKVPTRKKRNTEKRAAKYMGEEGERIYSPESHPSGVLLLRPDGTFAYVHDGEARFSEGVSGDWVEQADNMVVLEPRSYGYCYEENFDANEIVGVCHKVQVCGDRQAESGRLLCLLPPELQTRFSWLDPTKEE